MACSTKPDLFKDTKLLMLLAQPLLYLAMSGKNFSQSEDVAVGAISQFAFPPLARGDPSSVALCKSFEHVQQTNVPFHKSFERRVLYSQSVSSNLFIFSEEAHNQVRF